MCLSRLLARALQVLSRIAAVTPAAIIPVSALHKAGLTNLRQALRAVVAHQRPAG